MVKKLARIKEIKNLREVWVNEAGDFTKWLAEEENLDLLSETIGADLELIKTEADVGRYSVDILAKESNSGRKVIIENQIEPTNHDHLGKVITYAAGHDAVLAIWIVREAKEEHAKAVEWLNDHTDDSIGFFLIEIKLLQIGDSLPAAQFKLIVKPNEWAKAIKSDSGSRELTDTKQRQLQFWTDFRQYVSENYKSFSLQSPRAQHWYDFTIGTSLAHLSCGINTVKNRISCSLYISNNKGLYNYIYAKRDEIESILGHGEWFCKKVSGFTMYKKTDDPISDDEGKRKENFKWLISEAMEFKKIFLPMIKEFSKR